MYEEVMTTLQGHFSSEFWHQSQAAKLAQQVFQLVEHLTGLRLDIYFH